MPQPIHVGLALDIQLLYKNHTEVFAGVQRFADEAGWITVIDNWPQEALTNRPRGKRPYDGIVARVSEERADLVQAAAAARVPLVNIMCASPVFSTLPGVFPDYAEIGRLRADHLLARGVRNFAFISTEGRRADEFQFVGFKTAIESAGHPVVSFELPETWDEARSVNRIVRERMHTWMKMWTPPVGVATCSDDNLRFVAQLCHERGWRVPQDVALIGSRNEEHLCENPRPSLSSVEVGYERVGYEAAKLLETLMKQVPRRSDGSRKADPTPATHLFLPPVGIVARESTDSYASTDPIVADAQAFIARSCHTFIEVSDVAEAVMVSEKTLQNHFASAIQTTVAQEIRRARVERAKRELAGSDIPIDEVAKRSGFSSNARLSEVFRRDVGMSPRDYRRLRKLQRRR